MSTSAVLAIGLLALGGLAILVVVTRRRGDLPLLSRETVRSDRGASPYLQGSSALRGAQFEQQATPRKRTSKAVAIMPPVSIRLIGQADPDTIGVTRRQFFNRSVLAMTGLGFSGFGAATLAFLWPTASGGFGSKVGVGKPGDIVDTITASREPLYVPEGRFYISPFPSNAVSKAETSYSPSVLPAITAGIIALYQKCPHLGCRVPFCATSQWFECGCHGSQYNRVGEKKGGPAPRGMDQFPVEITSGFAIVDTGIIIQGQPIGTNTTGQEAEGPHCVSSAGAH